MLKEMMKAIAIVAPGATLLICVMAMAQTTPAGEVVTPATDPLIGELVKAVQTAYANGGWLAALATGLMFLVRLYRLPFIQSNLPAKAQWAHWPEWAKWVTPFALSFAGALILALVGKVAWAPAIVGAITTAIGAMMGHGGTKMLGEAEGKVRPITYEPSPFRKAGSIVVPLAKHIRENGLPPKG